MAEVTPPVSQLSPAEREKLLVTWNDTAKAFPDTSCVHELFEAQAARTPAAVAVVCGDAALTYDELNRQANRLAHHLRGLGVGPDSRVAICVERSLEMVVGLFAVLKAGGAYVPLDPAYPAERLTYMMANSAPAVVLTHPQARAPLDAAMAGLAEKPPVIDLDADVGLWSSSPSENPLPSEIGLTPEHLVYVIYTSGSTGAPKGVMNEHRGVVNRLWWMHTTYGMGPGDAVLQKTPFSFDVSVWEFFWPMLAGARLVMAKPEGHKDPSYLAGLIQREAITTIHFVPSMLALFVERTGGQDFPSLVNVFCSGEALPEAVMRRFPAQCPTAKLHNLYGPTEAAVDVTAWTCGDLPPGCLTPPIGKPIDNIRMYILDPDLQPVPVGAVGEIHIGGVGVARGYLNRADLTTERFIPNPFVEGDRLYKTGDLGRFVPDGNIEYLGRNDFQVKIRGFRIELGEIESVLLGIEGVGQAVVVAREVVGDMRLVAYVVAKAGATPPDTATLRATLAARLPDYMVPAMFVFMDALPLNANGKLDRAALPAPEIVAQAPYRKPRDETEEKICRLFAQLTGVEKVGLDDNFFDLGGHSLLGVRLIAEVERLFGASVPLGVLFAAPTPGQFAERLRRRDFDLPWTSLVPIQTAGDAAPIFLVHWIERDLARHLGEQRPIYGLSFGLAREDAHTAPTMPDTVADLATHYISEMRIAQPAGPYHLVGHSAGGVVAFEMAQQLRAAGEGVALLGLLDTCAPNGEAEGAVLSLGDVVRNILKTPFKVLVGYAASGFRERITRFEFVRRFLLRGQGLPTVFRLRLINKFINDYELRPYEGQIDFFRSMKPPLMIRHAPPPPYERAWATIAVGGLTVHEVPGDHMEIVRDPLAKTTAEMVNAARKLERRVA